MAPRDIEREIDRLYQLPLDQFTAARNALAKEFGGAGATRIKTLPKPGISAWAVNQLHWKSTPVWDALVKAATHLRSVHRAVLSGRSADLREADLAHRRALSAATKEALALLEGGGHAATPASAQAIARTLEALPSDEPPGRLSTGLEPAGFEALAGLAAALPGGSSGERAKSRTAPSRPAPTAAKGKPSTGPSAEARLAARKALTVATREAKAAAERARALDVKVRERSEMVGKARKEALRARAAFDRARQQMGEAERKLEDAEGKVEKAEREAAGLTRDAERAGAAAVRAEARVEELSKTTEGRS